MQQLKRGAGAVARGREDIPSLNQYSSCLANKLVDLVAWRHISPQLLQNLAMHTLADIQTVIAAVRPEVEDTGKVAERILPGLVKLAKLGSRGAYKNSINRDLKTALPPAYVPVNTVRIPLKVPGKQAPQSCDQHMIYPHRLFSAIYHHAKTAWSSRVCPSPDRLEQFWKSQESHPNFPILVRLLSHRPNWRRTAVPLKIHGDSCPVVGVGKSWAKSYDFTSWSSMVGKGSTLQLIYLIWGVCLGLINKSLDARLDTRKAFWKKVVWSFKVLFHGELLSYDHNDIEYAPDSVAGRRAGEKLCGDSDHSGVLWLLGADLEWFYKDYALPARVFNWHILRKCYSYITSW